MCVCIFLFTVAIMPQAEHVCSFYFVASLSCCGSLRWRNVSRSEGLIAEEDRLKCNIFDTLPVPAAFGLC